MNSEFKYVLGQYKTAESIEILEKLVFIFNVKIQEMIKTKQISTLEVEEIIAYENQLYSEALDRLYAINSAINNAITIDSTKKRRTAMKEFKINGCISVPEGITEEEFWNQFIDFIESKNWLFGGGINEYTDDTMRVEIKVKDKSLNDVIIQCFQKRNIKHDKDLVFIALGYKEDYSNMFAAMFELIKSDDIFPMLEKVVFIDQDGDREDVLSQAYKIREE